MLGLQEWEHVQIELTGAVFRAGSTFDSERGELAHLTLIEFDFNF